MNRGHFRRTGAADATAIEVAALVILGMETPEIAETLGLNIRTAKGYINRLFSIFNIPDSGARRVALALTLYHRRHELWGEGTQHSTSSTTPYI